MHFQNCCNYIPFQHFISIKDVYPNDVYFSDVRVK